MFKMFDFRCEDCQEEFEDIVTRSELKENLFGPCPECGSLKIVLLLTTNAKHASWEFWRTPVTDYY